MELQRDERDHGRRQLGEQHHRDDRRHELDEGGPGAPFTPPGNASPVAVNDAANTNRNTAATIAVLANDADADGDTLSVTTVTAPAHGTAVVNANGTVLYTPALNYEGADSFVYAISDNQGGTAARRSASRSRATRTWRPW